MQSYKTKIANNDKVELIHVSLDRDKEDALDWAQSAKFTWPHVLPNKHRSSGLMGYASGSVPHYVLIDKDGKELAVGKQAAFNKIAELK